jgi:hypothetical protein
MRWKMQEALRDQFIKFGTMEGKNRFHVKEYCTMMTIINN